MRMNSLIAILAAGAVSLTARVVCAQDTLFPARTWDALTAMTPDTLNIVKPYLADPASEVKEMPSAQIMAKMQSAAQKRLTVADIFTDELWTGNHWVYIRKETLAAVDKAYNLGPLTTISGTDLNGQPFCLEFILAGHGEVRLIYGRDKITYLNPALGMKVYFSQEVRMDIVGAGRLNFSGVTVDAPFAGPQKVKSIEKMQGNALLIKTGDGAAVEMDHVSVSAREPVGKKVELMLDKIRGGARRPQGLF